MADLLLRIPGESLDVLLIELPCASLRTFRAHVTLRLGQHQQGSMDTRTYPSLLSYLLQPNR